jgi:hypothetical protein
MGQDLDRRRRVMATDTIREDALTARPASPWLEETRRHCRQCRRATRQVRYVYNVNASRTLRPLFAIAEWLANPWDCLECPRMLPSARTEA